MLNTDTKGFTIENFAEFNRESSPSVPPAFPKSRLPKGDLCGHVLAELLLCTMNSAENLCSSQAKSYYMCRRERDAQIFSAIRAWETEKITTEKEPLNYIQAIEQEKIEAEKLLKQTNLSIANKHKRWRIQADIEQLDWRANYLRETLSSGRSAPL
mgnify:CR=1 FL=1